jgi:hypothetical protein
VSRVRHGPSNAAAHAFNGLTQALSRLQLTLPFDIYLIRRGRIARVFAAAGVSGVMAGGLCPSPVAVEGSARLTVFSQRGLHVSIPFRGDLPVIIGERDVAVVSPVALDKVPHLTIDDLGALQEISWPGILVSGVCLYKHEHVTLGIGYRHGLLHGIGGDVIARDRLCILGPDGCWAKSESEGRHYG